MSPEHAPTPCVEVGCYNLAPGRGPRCRECELLHKPADRPGRENPRERGYDQRWERRRRRHLAIEPTCRICADGQLGNQIDHVIPHQGARWLFDLDGNLQTLCRHHHATKSNEERAVPIAMMYPVDLPQAPHARPTRLICGPRQDVSGTHSAGVSVIYGDNVRALETRNRALRHNLSLRGNAPLWLAIAAPRTAERAFWAHVMGCDAELQIPLDTAMEGHPSGWWDAYMIDQRAEEAMEARS